MVRSLLVRYSSAYTWYMIVYASLDVGGTEESQRPRHGAAALVTSRELRPLDETVERHRAYIDAASGDN